MVKVPWSRRKTLCWQLDIVTWKFHRTNGTGSSQRYTRQKRGAQVHGLSLCASTCGFQMQNRKDLEYLWALTACPKPPIRETSLMGALPFVEQAHRSFGFGIQGERQELQGDWQRGGVLHHKVLHLDKGKGKSKPCERQHRFRETPAKQTNKQTKCITWN